MCIFYSLLYYICYKTNILILYTHLNYPLETVGNRYRRCFHGSFQRNYNLFFINQQT